jgi:hypothetical protein
MNFNEKDKQTEKIIEIPLGDDDIKNYLPNSKIMKYSDLKNYNKIEDLLKKNKDYAFILYEDSPNKGHWITILRYDPYLEYFDSYGGKVDNPLGWINEEKRRILKQDKKLLSNLFNKTKMKVIYNPIDYQEDNLHKDINTCGRHAVFRVKNLIDCDRKLEDYYNLMGGIKKQSGNSYDEIVSQLIDE